MLRHKYAGAGREDKHSNIIVFYSSMSKHKLKSSERRTLTIRHAIATVFRKGCVRSLNNDLNVGRIALTQSESTLVPHRAICMGRVIPGRGRAVSARRNERVGLAPHRLDWQRTFFQLNDPPFVVRDARRCRVADLAN
ncbi:hypothetical protein EVAR_13421_1 [Eumeta japonica]|uniref:Uncharacterized protein n=1 Tax=Eumeta variegata TaxID=151549 RepID=A0A4C1V7K0_EUMVA|nr:hypothetical protein EVAR_13421_1 [Eumeta japonica]